MRPDDNLFEKKENDRADGLGDGSLGLADIEGPPQVERQNKFGRYKKASRVLLMASAAFVIVGASCAVIAFWRMKSDSSPSQSAQSNAQNQQSSAERQNLFANIPSAPLAPSVQTTDKSGVVRITYPAAWNMESLSSQEAFGRQLADFIKLISPSAPTVSNLVQIKNGIGIYVISDIGDVDEFFISLLGYESPGVPFKPERVVINNQPGYYQKVQKDNYTDHTVLITKDKKALLFLFRESQHFSDETVGSGSPTFDESADLPVFKSIVSSATFL